MIQIPTMIWNEIKSKFNHGLYICTKYFDVALAEVVRMAHQVASPYVPLVMLAFDTVASEIAKIPLIHSVLGHDPGLKVLIS